MNWFFWMIGGGVAVATLAILSLCATGLVAGETGGALVGAVSVNIGLAFGGWVGLRRMPTGER